MQSRKGRLLVAAAAVAVVVAAFLVLREDEDATQSANPANEVTSTRQDQGGEPKTANQDEAPAEPEVPVITVEGGQPQGGVSELAFDKGDDIRFKVVSDVEDAIHVHGYDIEVPVGPRTDATFDFPAELDGVYEVELEQSAVPIAQLRINP